MKMEFQQRADTMIMYILVLNIMSSYFVIGQNPETEFRLRKELFSNHSNAIRPVTNTSRPIEIDAILELYYINKFDTIQGILVTQCAMEFSWYDEFLSWDPDKYANLSMLYVSAKQIWRPTIIFCNSLDAQFIDNEASNLVLHSDGRVVLWYQEILHTFCTIESNGYPFDKQNCNILICVAIHRAEHTTIRQLYSHKARFFQNFQWDVEMEGMSKSENNSGRSLVRATLSFSRKIKINDIAMLVPSAIFTVLSVFVFLLPARSGEKVSLATTLFLSLIVYLVEIEKLTPKNSKSMPLITLFMLTLTTLSGLNTIGAIIESRIYIKEIKKNMKKPSVPSDETEVKSATKKDMAVQVNNIALDHTQNNETENDDGVPNNDFCSNLGEENQPNDDVNYKEPKPRHERLSNILFGIGILYIITSIITISLTKSLLMEE